MLVKRSHADVGLGESDILPLQCPLKLDAGLDPSVDAGLVGLDASMEAVLDSGLDGDLDSMAYLVVS